MSSSNRQIAITVATREKVQAAKNFIEQRYSKLLQQEQLKSQYWQQLNTKMRDLNIPDHQQQILKKKILHEEAQLLRQQRFKYTISDFPSVKIIGRGAFGEVRLCKWNKISQPVAVKKLKKSEMIFKNKVLQSRQERNVLVGSQKNPWIVGLKCSFQDPQNLYLVMQYLPGGDLMNLLIKKDIFTHQQAQFFTAQILLALDSVHKMNYIHRDLKPDNILLDATGHIKLSDFGLCKHTEIRPKKLLESVARKQKEEQSIFKKNRQKITQNGIHQIQPRKRNRKLAYTAVGTPDYVAPEVQGKSGYSQTVDWWSMGVILFEMLVGYPPFASEDAAQTWKKIQNWRRQLVIPGDVDVSRQAADLIKKLIADPRDRLGVNGVQEIKAHPFFYGVNWSQLRNRKSPYLPQVKSSWDTNNFDQYEEQQAWIPLQSELKKTQKTKKKNPEFIGYTYKPIQQPNSSLLKALLDLDSYQPSQINKTSLDYLQLQDQSTSYPSTELTTININLSEGNKFKKDKTDRMMMNTAYLKEKEKGKETPSIRNKQFYMPSSTVYLESTVKKEREREKQKEREKELNQHNLNSNAYQFLHYQQDKNSSQIALQREKMLEREKQKYRPYTNEVTQRKNSANRVNMKKMSPSVRDNKDQKKTKVKILQKKYI